METDKMAETILKRCKAIKGIIDCTGEDIVLRRVSGNLFLSDDGVVLGAGARVVYPCSMIGSIQGFSTSWTSSYPQLVSGTGLILGNVWSKIEMAVLSKEIEPELKAAPDNVRQIFWLHMHDVLDAGIRALDPDFARGSLSDFKYLMENPG